MRTNIRSFGTSRRIETENESLSVGCRPYLGGSRRWVTASRKGGDLGCVLNDLFWSLEQ